MIYKGDVISNQSLCFFRIAVSAFVQLLLRS